MSYWAVGSTVASTALKMWGSNKAASAQRDAATRAQQARDAAATQANGYQQPYYAAGTDALGQLTQRMPGLTAAYDPSKLTSEPGYQFGLEQGQQALERSLAARGRGVSGAAMKAAAQYGTNYATTKLNDAFNRDLQSRQSAFDMLTGTARMGQAAGGVMGNNLLTAAGANARDITASGDVSAANALSQSNALGDLVNYGGSKFGAKFGNASNVPAPGEPGGVDVNGSRGRQQFQMADGGEVRVEPVVGTMGPRRGGGGGGMSREAVLAALDAARQAPAAQQFPGIGNLPADPTRKPGAILDAQARRAGAYADGGAVRGQGKPGAPKVGAVKGNAPGKADTVPAHLSDGEHVIDAETVSMLGDGNSEAGHALLEDLKARVRAFKRQAPANKPAPALRG